MHICMVYYSWQYRIPASLTFSRRVHFKRHNLGRGRGRRRRRLLLCGWASEVWGLWRPIYLRTAIETLFDSFNCYSVRPSVSCFAVIYWTHLAFASFCLAFSLCHALIVVRLSRLSFVFSVSLWLSTVASISASFRFYALLFVLSRRDEPKGLTGF